MPAGVAVGQSGVVSAPDVAADVIVRDLTAADAAAVAKWRYDGPWSVYDGNAADVVSAENGYHGIVERVIGRFLGYVCLGVEARVAGLGEEAGVLDVGIGLDPGIVGQGRGRSIAVALLQWIEERSEASELRAVIQAWNERTLRLGEGLGFRITGHHQVTQAGSLVDYVIVRRWLMASTAGQRIGPVVAGSSPRMVHSASPDRRPGPPF
jgi:[ribosomal protein S18]-alanine N-acetyltransferase